MIRDTLVFAWRLMYTWVNGHNLAGQLSLLAMLTQLSSKKQLASASCFFVPSISIHSAQGASV
jgi:hypothetical protein